jgi:hypothetical protein
MRFPWSNRRPDSSAATLPSDPQTVDFDFVFFRDLSGRSDARQVIRTVATAFPSVTLDEMSPDQKSWSDLELDAAAGLWADVLRTEPGVSCGQFYARAGPSRVDLAARWARPAQAGSNGFSMTFARASVEAPAGLEAAIDGFLGICRGLQPDYARAAAQAGSTARGPPDALIDVFWLNYFGRPYVDLFGREQLLASPALWVRDLGEGAALAIADSPWESSTPAAQHRAEDIKRFLGQDAFLDPRAPGRARRPPPPPA